MDGVIKEERKLHTAYTQYNNKIYRINIYRLADAFFNVKFI